MYEDNEGEDKSAMMKSDFPVQARYGARTTPPSSPTTRTRMGHDRRRLSPMRRGLLVENTGAGKTVGSPVDGHGR